MEIPGALREAVVRIDEFPAFPSIVAPVDSALFRFDDRVHAIPVSPRNRNPDAPQHTARQPMALEPLPCCSIIARAIQPAPRAAAGQGPWRALRFPKRR